MRARALVVAVCALALLAACDNMANQPKRNPYEVYRGKGETIAHRLPPADTVARDAEPPPAPPPVTLALLQRGQERFDIYCAPCHARVGDGKGMIVQRGFPSPPSYYSEKLLKAPSQHFYDVITNGYGVMYSYAQRVAPKDRWAIVAYIRALQASQHATLADVPAAERGLLK